LESVFEEGLKEYFSKHLMVIVSIQTLQGTSRGSKMVFHQSLLLQSIKHIKFANVQAQETQQFKTLFQTFLPKKTPCIFLPIAEKLFSCLRI
jgi:hypothetical protein